MTLTNMISDVRFRAGDLGADRYPDKLITEWINQGYRDLAARLPVELLKASTTSSDIAISVASGARYDLPASFVQYVNALYDGNNKCMRLSQENRTLVNDNSFFAAATADPFCIVWEDDIELFPTPTSTATLSLYYIAKPTDLSAGTNSPKLPDNTHALLVLYATAQAMREIGNFPAAKEYLNDYEMKVAEIRYLYAPTGAKETGRRNPGIKKTRTSGPVE